MLRLIEDSSNLGELIESSRVHRQYTLLALLQLFNEGFLKFPGLPEARKTRKANLTSGIKGKINVFEFILSEIHKSFAAEGLKFPLSELQDLAYRIDGAEVPVIFLDDEGFDWNHDITKAINLLRHRNIPAVVANSDMTYPIARNEVAVATGGIAALVEHIVQQDFIHFGKPDLQMFFHAYEHLSQEIEIDRSEILMVGDTLETDIMGGNKFGLKTALTLTGNTSPERYKTKIKSSGIFPDYICETIGS